MLSTGKLFAIAAIAALLLGVARWPAFGTGFYAITIKNRVYGFGQDLWAFSTGAIFALLAASYYWFPIFFSRSMNSRMSLLHFWPSALAAFAFLLVPGIYTLTSPRSTAVPSDRAMMVILTVATMSAVLFLIAQIIFVASFLWSAYFAETFGQWVRLPHIWMRLVPYSDNAVSQAVGEMNASVKWISHTDLGGKWGSSHQIQEVSNKTNTNEIVRCDFQPKPIWFFGAVDPTMKPDPRLASTRPNHSRGKWENPEY
jgi:hypothetical protein